MRIAYLSTSLIPSRTANSIQVMRMCEAFSSIGHQVLLLAPHREELLEPGIDDVFNYYGIDAPFHLKYLPWPRLRGRRHLYAISCVFQSSRWNSDVVYGRALLGLMWAALFGKEVILELHAPPTSETPLDRWALRYLAHSRRLRHVVAISRGLATLIQSMFPDHKILVCHNAAKPLDLAAQSAEPPTNVVPAAAVHVGYFGHLYPGRGIDLIIDIAAQMPDAQFTLLGGTEKDLNFWLDQSIPSNVTFCGHVPAAKISETSAGFDILLMPYQDRVAVHGGSGDTSSWMSPLKMFEYMAAGRPIVASDLPVLREILVHKRNAWIVPYNDTKAWVDAIAMLAADPELRKKLGREAQETQRDAYTWTRRASCVLVPD